MSDMILGWTFSKLWNQNPMGCSSSFKMHCSWICGYEAKYFCGPFSLKNYSKPYDSITDYYVSRNGINSNVMIRNVLNESFVLDNHA